MNEFKFEIPVKWTESFPVFVVGIHGSGQTILNRILRKYFRINMDTQFHKFLPIYSKLKRDSRNQNSNLNRSIISEINNLDCVRDWQKKYGLRLSAADLTRGGHNSFSDIVRHIFVQLNEKPGLHQWGYDCSSSVHLCFLLREIFPEARFIHLVRDGREIAFLNHSKVLTIKNTSEVANYWAYRLRKIEELKKKMPVTHFHLLKYESLTQNPEVALFLLKKFFKIEDEGDQVMRFISNNIRKEIDKQYYQVWKSKMPLREVKIFEEVAGEYLTTYGYKLVYSKERRPQSPAISYQF